MPRQLKQLLADPCLPQKYADAFSLEPKLKTAGSRDTIELVIFAKDFWGSISNWLWFRLGFPSYVLTRKGSLVKGKLL